MQSDPTLTPDLPHNNHKTAEVALKVWMPKDLRNDLKRMAQSRSISLAALDHTHIIDDRHILFRLGVDTHYLNVLPRPCRGLSHHDALRIDSRNGRLCDVDWVRAIDSGLPLAFGMRGRACGLGAFLRLERRAPAGDATPQR